MDFIPPTEHQSAIVVTASRMPTPLDEAAASTSIVDDERLERLGETAIASYLRLLPSTSVATSGPAGSFTQVRIRGAEANHSLLFIDGIRANDPAAGNEPRFELLGADIASRIELVRGPQSALWGSEAIGGVIAVSGDPAATTGASGTVEGGSFGFRRAAASANYANEMLGIALAFGHQASGGIDSFDGDGERDGFTSNVLRGLARWEPVEKFALTASGFWLSGRSDYDGTDPFTFLRADTLDRTRNRLAAGRLGLAHGKGNDSWQARLSGSMLTSRNRNLIDGLEINESGGRRATVEAQIEHRLTRDHRLIVAAEHERERFEAEDPAGLASQDQARRRQSIVGEWRGDFGRVIADVAIRHDLFQRFKDATTVRASLLGKLTAKVSVAASYGESIAQPTFYDLFGFFPGIFIGNPSLQTESSEGLEISLRIRERRWSGAFTVYRHTLRDEIVNLFTTAVNAEGKSRRSGAEAEVHWTPSDALRITANYAYLKATERDVGASVVREVRRPTHSGSLMFDGTAGKFTYGASIAYVGRRADTDFDLFQRVSLSPYWLAGARVAFAVRPGVELFGRIANAFDDRYQDVVGYRTEGRSAYAGLRLAVDR